MRKEGSQQIERPFFSDPNEVHVWTVNLKSIFLKRSQEILAGDEISSARRFHFASDRDAFPARRIARRRILSGYTDQSPQELVFVSNIWGKPGLAGLSQQKTVEFNTTSSRDRGVIAVSTNIPLGVDIEFNDPQVDFLSVARCFCTDVDLERLRGPGPTSFAQAFYRLWTETEALGKAQGEELSRDFRKTISLQRGPNGRESHGRSSVCTESGVWWLVPLELDMPGYTASPCTASENVTLRYFSI